MWPPALLTAGTVGRKILTMKIRFFERYNKGAKDEYLGFKVEEDCNIHQYLIYDTTFGKDGELSNLLPHMYRFPSQVVNKGAYVYLYIHDIGNRKAVDTISRKENVFRFSWGLDSEVSVFNKEKDFLHIAEINETRVAMIEGK